METEKYCGCGCGKVVSRRFLPGHQARVRNLNRENNPHWKGGRYINDDGYVLVYMPGHKGAMQNGYVREHIVFAEKALGRELPQKAQVHHPEGNENNGAIIICEGQQYHRLLHMRHNAYLASGNPNFRKCRFCKEYDDPKNLYIRQREREGWIIYHKKCENKQHRERNRCDRIKRIPE